MDRFRDDLRAGRIKVSEPRHDFSIAEATRRMADAFDDVRQRQMEADRLARRRHRHILVVSWVTAVAAIGAFVATLVALLR